MATLSYDVWAKGSTGTGRQFINNLQDAKRVEVEFEVEAVGATPTVTFAVLGLRAGGDTSVTADWQTLALLQFDSTVAASNAAITVTATGKTQRFVDGLDKRFFDAYAVSVSANTNITFSARIKRSDS